MHPDVVSQRAPTLDWILQANRGGPRWRIGRVGANDVSRRVDETRGSNLVRLQHDQPVTDDPLNLVRLCLRR